MMMLFVTDAAVGADQLDAVFLDAVDGSQVDTVRADHFHMLANILEAAHDRLLLFVRAYGCTLPPGPSTLGCPSCHVKATAGRNHCGLSCCRNSEVRFELLL